MADGGITAALIATGGALASQQIAKNRAVDPNAGGRTLEEAKAEQDRDRSRFEKDAQRQRAVLRAQRGNSNKGYFSLLNPANMNSQSNNKLG